MKTVRFKLAQFSPALVALCFALTFVNACTKPKSQSAAKKSTNKPENLFKSAAEGTGLTLTAAVRADSGLASDVNLLGDGSGAIGSYCLPEESVEGSGCHCHINYERDNGDNEAVNTPPSYFETDLIRCPLTLIPSDAKSATVRIRVVAPSGDEAYSNAMTLDLNAPGQADPRNAFNYLQARRYQCREIAMVNYSFGGNGVYDPILSKSPLVAQAMNYYSTNVGGHMMEWAQGQPESSRGFECETDPELGIFGNNKLFYNSAVSPDLTSNRVDTNFSLARTPAAGFVRAVNAYVSPTLTKLIGYAAKSIPVNGHRGTDAEESCPNISLPSGKKMVKIWAFRGKLPDRQYPYSPEFVAPGQASYSPTSLAVPMMRAGEVSTLYPNCGGNNNGSDTLTPTTIPNTVLMQRSSNSGDATTYCGLRNQGSDTLVAAPATLVNFDLHPVPYLSSVNDPVDKWNLTGCGTNPYAPFRLCYNHFSIPLGGNLSTTNAAVSTAQPPIIYSEASDGNELRTYKVPGAANRYDFIFVATPTSFNTKDWQNSQTPKRWVGKDSECATNSSACSLVTYELKLGDPTRSLGDVNESEGPIFPLCAVQ